MLHIVKVFLDFCRLRFWLHSSEMIQIRIYGMLEDHSDQGASKVLMNLWDLAVPLMHKRMWNDLRSWILLQIISKESLHPLLENEITAQFYYTARTLPQQNNIAKSWCYFVSILHVLNMCHIPNLLNLWAVSIIAKTI